MMLHTKYYGSRPSGFREEDVSCFPYVKHVTPGVGLFLTPGYNFNKFGKGLLYDATY